MKIQINTVGIAITGAFFSVLLSSFFPKEDTNNYKAFKAETPPKIDGIASEAIWKKASWKKIDEVWLGKTPVPSDFEGRYKAVWTKDKLFLLVEVTDDSLMDSHPNGLVQYWDDDCVEVFIDENHSGGNHQYNYNAFAYHIGLDYKVADIGTDSVAHYYNDHVATMRTKKNKTYTWEMAISIYDDSFQYNSKTNKPLVLQAGKKMGFMLAYCDNDKSPERENFVGSVPVAGSDKNRGWIDASIFGTIELLP